MPGKDVSGFWTACRLPAAVIFLGVALCLALPQWALAGWTNTGNIDPGRKSHTSTLLPNGKVLIAGGSVTGGGMTASAQLYDPATNFDDVRGASALPWDPAVEGIDRLGAPGVQTRPPATPTPPIPR